MLHKQCMNMIIPFPPPASLPRASLSMPSPPAVGFFGGELSNAHGCVHLATLGPAATEPCHFKVCRSYAVREKRPGRQRAVLVCTRRINEVNYFRCFILVTFH